MDTVKVTIGPHKTKKVGEAAKQVLSNGVASLNSLEAILKDEFPFQPFELSKAESSFQECLVSDPEDNQMINKAIVAARNAMSGCVANIQALEAWIMLSTPQMEDGNNFGVSVQQAVAKYLKETREELMKSLEGVPSYYDSRAGAVEKLNLPKSTQTVTRTKTKLDSKGGKDGDENKSTQNVVEEDKESGRSLVMPNARVRQIVALDVKFYMELRTMLVNVMNSYASILDNVEKNYSKLAEPKGGSQGRNMMSMF